MHDFAYLDFYRSLLAFSYRRVIFTSENSFLKMIFLKVFIITGYKIKVECELAFADRGHFLNAPNLSPLLL